MVRFLALVVLVGCGGAVTIDETAEWEAVRSETVRLTCDEAGEVSLGPVDDGAIVQVYACGDGDCQPVAVWRLASGEVRVDCDKPGAVFKMRTLTPIGMRWARAN